MIFLASTRRNMKRILGAPPLSRREWAVWDDIWATPCYVELRQLARVTHPAAEGMGFPYAIAGAQLDMTRERR